MSDGSDVRHLLASGEPFAAYLAPEGLEEALTAELSAIILRHGRLLIAKGRPQPAAFAQNTWLSPQLVNVASIGDAVRVLRAKQRSWWPYAPSWHRRATLIQEQLPKVAHRPLAFKAPTPLAPLGSYTLLAPNLLLASAECSSPFPNGEIAFVEDRDGPPSRAYLKLLEALTVLNAWPGADERCLELGASPGGWTYVLARLGARVTTYDRAPLAPHVAAMTGVTVVKGDAFGATPAKVGPIDWLFSDVICYPQKLLAFIKEWVASGQVANIVCTIKFQGTDHYDVLGEFRAIAGAKLFHLHHNKHEITFARLVDRSR